MLFIKDVGFWNQMLNLLLELQVESLHIWWWWSFKLSIPLGPSSLPSSTPHSFLVDDAIYNQIKLWFKYIVDIDHKENSVYPYMIVILNYKISTLLLSIIKFNIKPGIN